MCFRLLLAFGLAAGQVPAAPFLDATVVDAAGRPVEGATVRVALRIVSVLDLNVTPLALATTDRDGRARVPLTPSGAPLVIVTAAGYRTVAFMPASVPRPIVLERGRDVAFTIRDGQKPVKGRVDWAAAPNITVSVSSDEQGQGVIPGLGETPMQVTGHGALRSVTARVEAAARQVELTLPPEAIIEGRTIDEDGRPLAGAIVSLAGPVGPEPRTTDADGRFRVGQLSAGR